MAMKVRFLKEHVKWKAGEVVNFDNTMAKYLSRMQAAEIIGEEVESGIEETLIGHLQDVKKEDGNSIVPASTQNKKTTEKKTVKKTK